MSDYVPPDPTIAEVVHQRKQELQHILSRLQSLSDEDLRAVVHHDDNAMTRQVALGLLCGKLAEKPDRDPEKSDRQLVDLCSDLLDDADPEIARQAIRHCPLVEAQHIEKVRRAMDCDHPQVHAAAAVALAKVQDPTVLARLLEWFHGDDDGYRNAAIESLRALNTDDARQVLADSYESGGRNEMDKLILACALLRISDLRGVPFLESLAHRAKGTAAALAATSLYAANMSNESLRRMLLILDNGDNEARQHLVSQICYGWQRSPHAYAVDGIHEARHWLQRKLASEDKTPTRFR